MSPKRPRPPFVAVALFAAVAWNLSAQGQQAPPTAQRPGETARRSPASTAGGGENTAVIKGRVVGPDGRPLRQAEIQLFGLLAREPRHEQTDADGGYEASGLLPDSYSRTFPARRSMPAGSLIAAGCCSSPATGRARSRPPQCKRRRSRMAGSSSSTSRRGSICCRQVFPVHSAASSSKCRMPTSRA